jgi:DNA polymerase-3 subunit gamma/tau
LLDLIDQFAVAEGRMKWAPNKKLHFEVAIIRAIQTLGQATLDEVIQKLGELRDGKTDSQKESSSAAGGRGTPKRREDGAPTAPKTADGTAAATAAPRVAERAELDYPDPSDLWQKVLNRIPAKSFLRTLSELIRPIGVEGRNFVLGHSPDDTPKVEALASANNRRQLEALLRQASGRDWSVKFVAKDEIPPSDGVVSDTSKSTESFKDDPLIQQAIELFKAQVRS